MATMHSICWHSLAAEYHKKLNPSFLKILMQNLTECMDSTMPYKQPLTVAKVRFDYHYKMKYKYILCATSGPFY